MLKAFRIVYSRCVCVFCLPPSHFVSPEPEIEIGRRSQILFKELHFEKGARSLPLSHWFISFLSSRKRKEAGSLLELPVVQRRRRRVCVWRERTALPLVPGPTSASTDSYKREKRNFFPSSLFIFFLSSCPFVHLDSGVAARAQIWIGKDRVDRTGARPSAAGQFPALRSLLHSLYSRRWPSHAQFSSSFFFTSIWWQSRRFHSGDGRSSRWIIYIWSLSPFSLSAHGFVYRQKVP